MRAICVGTFLFLTVGVCLGQTKTPTRPSQDSRTTLNIVSSPAYSDFEAKLHETLKQGKLRPRGYYDYGDYSPNLNVFPLIMLPGYCFTMRTYIFVREAPDSALRYRRYLTCASSNTFQMHDARTRIEGSFPQ